MMRKGTSYKRLYKSLEPSRLLSSLENQSNWKLDLPNFLESDEPGVMSCFRCSHCEVVEETQRCFCRRPLGTIGYVPVKPDDFCSYGEVR